ncbi:MAG: hypothetical protein ACHQFW_02380 [Chitinophagales bacterium]
MKIKILFFVLGAGLILASCSDKEAEAKIADLEKQMLAKDSTCMANTQMLMDSIMTLRESMMNLNKVSSSTTTTKTTVTPAEPKTIQTKEGATNKKIDIKKKGGATGGN